MGFARCGAHCCGRAFCLLSGSAKGDEAGLATSSFYQHLQQYKSRDGLGEMEAHRAEIQRHGNGAGVWRAAARDCAALAPVGTPGARLAAVSAPSASAPATAARGTTPTAQRTSRQQDSATTIAGCTPSPDYDIMQLASFDMDRVKGAELYIQDPPRGVAACRAIVQPRVFAWRHVDSSAKGAAALKMRYLTNIAVLGRARGADRWTSDQLVDRARRVLSGRAARADGGAAR